jgi:hypothetical protein
MEGEIRGWDIKKDDVLEYSSNMDVSCILMGMGTTPRAERTRRTQYGARLISGFIEFLENLASRGITITKFYATSSTPTGIALLRNAGFKEAGKIERRIKFELDIHSSEAVIVKEYNKIVKENKKTTERQQHQVISTIQESPNHTVKAFFIVISRSKTRNKTL